MLRINQPTATLAWQGASPVNARTLFLLVLSTIAAYIGCGSQRPSDEDTSSTEAQSGTVAMQLTSSGQQSGTYCVSGTIRLTGPNNSSDVTSIRTDCNDSDHSVVLLPGTYRISMRRGFDCSISDGPNVEECTFNGPRSFNVETGRTTQVALRFTFTYNEQAPEEVVFGVGGAELTMDAGDDINLLCGTVECSPQSVCAVLDDSSEPLCYALCQSDLNCGTNGNRCLPVADEDDIWTVVPGNTLMHICRPPNGGQGTGGATGTGGTTGTGGAGQGTGGTTSTGGTNGGMDCIPGVSVGCACPNGMNGAQSCNSSGSGYGACECTGSGTPNGVCNPGDCMNCTCTNGNAGAQWCLNDGSSFGSCNCAETGGSHGGDNNSVCIPGQSVSCVCSNGATGAQACNSSGSGYGSCSCTSISSSGTGGTSSTSNVCIPGQTRVCTCTSGATGAQACNSSGSGYGTCSCSGTGGSTSTSSTESVTIQYTAPSGATPIQVVVQGQINGYNNIWGDLCNSQIYSVSGLSHPMTRSGNVYTCTILGAPANQSILFNVEVRYSDSTFTPSNSAEQYACWGDWGSAGCSQSNPCWRDFGETRVQGSIVSLAQGSGRDNYQSGCNYNAAY